MLVLQKFFAVVAAVVADVVGDARTAYFVAAVAVAVAVAVVEAVAVAAVVGPEGVGDENMAAWGEFHVCFRSKRIPSLSVGTFVMAEFVYVLDRTETAA